MKTTINNMLTDAGIEINGSQPSSLVIRSPDFYRKVYKHGIVGFGEAYMEGDWTCADLPELFTSLALADKGKRRRHRFKTIHRTRNYLLNLQNRRRALEVTRHYNLSNDMFELMLDRPYMQYSCAYYDTGATTLEQAQAAKLELICRKLDLRPGEKVLEIGGGWGGLARYMAEKYGVEVVTINIAREQIAYARARCQGLPVAVVEMDYRDIHQLGRFDKVVSIAMFEAVGPKNYRTYLQAVHDVLKDDGIFLLHTIGDNLTREYVDLWILKYIFPNGHIPSIQQLGTAMERLFVMEDWHSLGTNYATTLLEWHRRFNDNWDTIVAKTGFDEKFRRTWNYYLCSSAGSFKARNVQLWQLVLTKHKSGTAPDRARLNAARGC